MQGVWYDGRVAAAHAAEARLEGESLVIALEGAEVRWPLDRVRASESDDGRIRLTGPPGDEGRMIAETAAWRALLGDRGAGHRRRSHWREGRLVAGLAAAGLTGALIVFFGVPAASGPLAAMTPVDFERRIGRNFEGQVTTLFKRCRADAGGARALAGLGEALEAQAETPLDVRVSAVEAPMVNAFALPGGAVFVTDDLIAASRTPDELAGVIAHEVAHIEQRHVMRAVWRSLGAGLLLDLFVGGGSGAGQQAVLLAGSFTELSYSRELEREADTRGRALLHAAGYSSRGMASFFRKLANEDSSAPARAFAEFLGSHPDTRRRAERAEAAARAGRPALDPAQWQAVRRLCAGGSGPSILRLKRRRADDRRPPAADQVDQVRPDGLGGGRP